VGEAVGLSFSNPEIPVLKQINIQDIIVTLLFKSDV